MTARQDLWRELSPLLDHAFELEGAEREQWLTSLSVSRPDIERELRALLAEDSRLEVSAPSALQPLAALLDAQPSLAGTHVGPWQLERLIGQGGMGAVWLARRVDGRFEGQAAVKLLNPSLLARHGEARFRSEGSVLAKLSHPNIARLLDAGVTASRHPYLVLEYVDGERIDRYCERRQLDRPARLQLFMQVLDAVGHAHANLVVHRDIKPSNILVTDAGVVKLLDFGIATMLDADPGDAGIAEGRMALTPEFAAPEQLRGEAVTTATDVYGLGVLLYVLLAGRHPTAGASRTLADLVRSQHEQAPDPLGLGDLDLILLKALQKRADARYQTVAAFSADLLRCVRHEPVSAHRDTMPYRAGRFVRRQRVAVAIGTVVAAALLVATNVSVTQSREARRQRDAAVLERKRVDAQMEFQGLLLSEVGDRPVTMREILDKGRAVVEQQYGADAPYLSSILIQLSHPYVELGETRVPALLLARAESIATMQHDSARLADIRCSRADLQRLEGHPEAAMRSLDSAAAILRAHPDVWTEVECLGFRALLADELNDAKASGLANRRAIAILDSLGETKGQTYIVSLGGLGDAFMTEGKLRDAQRMYARAIGLMDSSGRGGMMSGVIMRHNLALTFEMAGEMEAAERMLHDVIVRAMKGDPTGRAPVQALIHYAQAAFVQGQYDSATKYFEQLAEQGAKEGSRYWESRGTFGMAQSQLRHARLDEARRTVERFRRVSTGLKNRRTDDHFLDVRSLDAQLALARGNAAAALPLLVDLLRSGGYYEGKHKRQMHSALMLAAEASVQLNQGRNALAYAGEARRTATRDSLTERRSLYVGEARLMETRAYLTLGDTVQARLSVAQAVPALTTGGGGRHFRTLEAVALQRRLPAR